MAMEILFSYRVVILWTLGASIKQTESTKEKQANYYAASILILQNIYVLQSIPLGEPRIVHSSGETHIHVPLEW